jgi:hypothetical protein
MRMGAAVGVLIGLLPAGCLSVSPRVDHVPAIERFGLSDEVHAFRAELTDSRAGYGEPNHCQMLLTPLPLGADGSVPAQTGLSWEFTWDSLVTRSDAHRWHGLRVRLYRRGYQLEERLNDRDSGPGRRYVKMWSPAASLADREKAIDDLFTAWPLGNYYGTVFTGRFGHVASGGASKGHREALQFAADEYQRLAAEAKGIDEASLATRGRLLEKAARLRELADRGTVTAEGAGAATPGRAP